MTAALAYRTETPRRGWDTTIDLTGGEIEIPRTDTSGVANDGTDESQAWGALSLEYHFAGHHDVAEFCNWMAGADKPEGLNETECLWQLYDDDMLPVPARNFPCLMIARPDGY